MRDIFRHILAIICLVAFVASGTATACVCEFSPPDKACETHDHSHDGDSDKQSHSNETDCPCATCHNCQHITVVLPTVFRTISSDAPQLNLADSHTAVHTVALDIFIPPKLG